MDIYKYKSIYRRQVQYTQECGQQKDMHQGVGLYNGLLEEYKNGNVERFIRLVQTFIME